MLRYERLADDIRAQIAHGTLRAGERLPSIRQLAQGHGVSAATAVEAYLQLEREGIVVARARSGYFVHAPSSPSPTIKALPKRAPGPVRNPALQHVLAMLAREDVFPLHSGTPGPSLLPQAALAASLGRCMRHARTASFDYAPPQGHEVLRRQIAQRYGHVGATVSPDEIVITAGTMEAIHLALRTVTVPGDVVLVETPTYHGILQTLAALRLKVVETPNRPGQGIDVERLGQLLAQNAVKAAVLVPNFNNPLGSLTSDADKQALLKHCARHGTIVIEDDIYGEMAWSGQRPSPLRRWDTDGIVISCGSFSKILAPGLRVGWMAGGAWTDELTRAKYFSTVSSASLPQLAIADYLRQHDLERHLRRLRKTVADNAHRLRDAIYRQWPPGTRVSDPQGGLSLWLQLPSLGGGVALFEAALEKGIGTSPGVLFSRNGDHADCLRISCGLPWDDRLDRAVKQLGLLARHVC